MKEHPQTTSTPLFVMDGSLQQPEMTELLRRERVAVTQLKIYAYLRLRRHLGEGKRTMHFFAQVLVLKIGLTPLPSFGTAPLSGAASRETVRHPTRYWCNTARKSVKLGFLSAYTVVRWVPVSA
jgi:hypothetical protein